MTEKAKQLRKKNGYQNFETAKISSSVFFYYKQKETHWFDTLCQASIYTNGQKDWWRPWYYQSLIKKY